MEKYTLINNFHNTSVNVRCDGAKNILGEIEIKLSKAQLNRTKKALCGVNDCKCSNESGMRGRQFYYKTGHKFSLSVNF